MRQSTTHELRRGMLLLLTLLMLSLFLGAGAMLLTIAARARAASRAFAAATKDSAANDRFVRRALDEALMSALRGSSSGTTGSVLATGPLFENILADKYGNSGATIGSGLTPGPLITISIASIPPSGTSSPNSASRLNGRVLTIKPAPADGDITSFRILGAVDNGSGATCYLANMPTGAVRRLPPPSASYPVIINGREFTPAFGTSTPEAYDAFRDDTGYDSDLYLAQPVLSSTCQVVASSYISFVGPSGTSQTDSPVVDNDNDGVPDGVWIPTSITSPSGTAVLPDQPSPLGGTLRFQVSYLILDLDSRININAAGIASGTGSSYPSGQGVSNVGVGMGYGPADVDASLLFLNPPVLPPVDGVTAFVSTGSSAAPIWAPLVFGGTSSLTSTSPLPNTNQRRPPPLVGPISGRYGPDGVPGSPGDDTNAYQTTTSSGYAVVVAGSNAIADLQGRGKVYMTGPAAAPTLNFSHPSPSTDAVNDPYELRLDEHTSRSAATRVAGSSDAVFTAAELERVLRANDPDAVQLPQRLAAGTSDLAQRVRTTITTDSWDTPALTGTTARKIEDFVANHPSLTLTSWTSGSNGTSVNSVSPDVAAGLRFNINRPVNSLNEAEREEYCKGLFTVAVALGASPGQAAQWAANTLDFRDSDAVMTQFRYDSNPADGWQLASPPLQVWGIERPELVIRSVTEDPTSNNVSVMVARPWRQVNPATKEVIDPALGNAPNDLVLRQTVPIWQLALMNGATQIASTDLADGSTMAPGETRALTPSGFTLPTGPGDYKVVLRRLANPSAAPNTTTNPYAVVDELAKVNGNIWPPNPTFAWTHWPNRPFISHAELAMVPAGYGSSGPDSSLAVQIPELLDAVYVPSRFAGNAVNVPGGAGLGPVGLDKLQFNQLSKWREPGRVNVNTITSGTNPGLDENDVVWTTLTGSPTMNNPFAAIPRTPTQPANPGAPGGGATPATPRQPGEPARPVKSIAQLLSLNSDPGLPPYKDTTLTALQASNPYLQYAKAIRLANTATIRSQVFAIWITVQITDDSPNAPSPVTRRLFAIVDRSIPVGYMPGQDINVRNCIKIKRYLD